MNAPQSTDLRLVLCVALVALSGCARQEPVQRPDPDQKMRREIFMECLRTVPTGPQATKYNDWSEVVNECGEQAYYISLRLGEAAKVEK